MLSKNKVEKLLALEGEVRGDVLKTDYKYILEKEGRKGFDKLNAEIKKIQKDLGYHKIINTSWYPIGWKVIIMELCKDLFNWNKKSFYNMGCNASSDSFLTRTILRYFISFKKTFKESSKYWKKYWNVGTLNPYKLDLENKYFILRLKNFHISSDMCYYLQGHFKSFASMILSVETTVKETKCPYKNKKNGFHEFIIKW